ncbi:MAG: outer membrane lipoprotein-sorting protein [Bryobacteraceae bacterium]|nr:outer membrane lipoprotein-sorting protein [Bryobacteraceae bacterium]MDW8376519.1 hypothetical protein [Bryobacterales bacterium]
MLPTRRKPHSWLFGAYLALRFAVFCPAADFPLDLLRRVLERETATEAARAHYAYRQVVHLEELSEKGQKRGEYREWRDVIFSPEGRRYEKPLRPPYLALERLKLTEEDFRDLREVQPFLFTREQLPLYETQDKGEETVGGHRCWVLRIRPRQILYGQRLFDGLAWVNQADFSVIQMEGKAVPEIVNRKEENLFPRFTTVRKLVDGQFWFPDRTFADDTLAFRSGPVRVRLTIQYSDYKKFQAETTIRFTDPK